MTRLLTLLLALFALALTPSLPAHAADDISAASRSVVRVVTVAMVDGEVVGFGHGSGIAISPTRIVTNAHVVESAVKYPGNVALGVVPSEGQKSYAGKLIAIDTTRDLALIEITEGRLPAAAVYTGPLESGTDVVALGYPGNVDLATARSAADYITPRTPTRSEGNLSNTQAVDGVAMLVHTAKISRGNSGGPLVDGCGRITGINTAITRADDGDSPFAFAISTRELARFLADADQQYAGIGTPCLSMAEADARDRAALDAESRASAEANAAKEAAAKLDRELKQARAEEAALASRENRIALAGVLFVIGALAAGAGLLFYSQKNIRNAKIAGGAGAVLVLGAAVLFVTRPDAHAELADTPAPGAATGTATAALAEGQYLCTIQPERSRVTVSATTDVPVKIHGGGCVNDRTQYAQGSDGRWQRILVPNEEATVTVASIDQAGKEYRVDRYLLDAETMAKAREIRAGTTLKGCTTDAGALAALATQQEAIRSALPPSPNERLVYRCQKSTAAAAAAAGSNGG
ncbi:S1C family serine protease [Sphingopyxis macrogoltabida]|uniref:Peptidase S1 n=1 Tax=Sphingopyxis macrogoltabida TaxID=33050 RepID=A0AAC9FG92_SPHMC|nr:serine protease [Sphingopyxis macrogoltabida]ALJ15010.1 peptidase S1 and S6, chymotrypsin/Hap [Sphingopyxis macrogoltabida]AMU91258.1 peptidase S1 [Sphingopyxis macrogoltabida]